MSWNWKKDKPAPAAVAAPTPPPAGASCPLLRPFLRRAEKVQAAPRILLVGELCGANVTWLGERGFRVSVEKDLGPESRPLPEEFAGVILWDTLTHLSPVEAREWAGRIGEMLGAGGAVLAFFDAPTGGRSTHKLRHRILSEEKISAEPTGARAAAGHAYANREIIRLFEGLDLELLHTHKNGQREALFFKGKPASST